MYVILAIIVPVFMTVAGQGCISVTGIATSQLTATSASNIYTAGVYSAANGITMMASAAVINAPNPVTVSGWGISDNTVLRAKFTANGGITTFILNFMSANTAVKSQITDSITYFGFKAS